MAKMLFRLPKAPRLIENPSPDEVKELATKMPNAKPTKYGNAQRADPGREPLEGARPTSSPTSPTARTRRSRARKATSGPRRRTPTSPSRTWSSIDGFIGNDPDFRTPARLYHRGRERQHRGDAAAALLRSRRRRRIEPELTVIYTPNLKAEGYPDDRLIAVDLEQGVTRVFNSDYFGESKKGGLRMWNKLVYDRGGLPLHAGCKIIPTRAAASVGLIVGLSGHRQDDDHVHAPERLAARAGRLRRLDARRPDHGDRERLLRQDLRAQPRRRADDLRRGHAAATRTSRTSRSTATRSTSTTRATRRTAARPSRSA